MELTAAVEGLGAIEGRRRVHLYSDSAYVVNCFRERWWERWERQGWRNAGKQPVANRDLWERLLAQSRRHDVVRHKVLGHSGDLLNDRVDLLARRAIATLGTRCRCSTCSTATPPLPCSRACGCPERRPCGVTS